MQCGATFDISLYKIPRSELEEIISYRHKAERQGIISHGRHIVILRSIRNGVLANDSYFSNIHYRTPFQDNHVRGAGVVPSSQVLASTILLKQILVN